MSGLSLYGSGLTITEAQGPNYYLGTWNASTNTPTLASSTAPAGPAGSYYIVSVAGTTTLNGISDWTVGDWVIWSGSVWQKLEGGATAITVGSTAISGGTSGRVLYDNGGTLGEYTVTGTAGSVVLSASPTLTGVATVTGGTVTANAPVLNVTQTWNNAAVTFTGIQANITNTASNTLSNILDLQVGGVSQCSVRNTGTLTIAGNFQLGSIGTVAFRNRSYISSGADGYVDLFNNAGTGFTGLRFGGTTASFPAIKRNTTSLETKLADDSAYTNHSALSFTSTGSTWANIPAAGSAGRMQFVSNAGTKGSVWMDDGTRWKPLNGSAVLATLDAASSNIANTETIVLQTLIPAGMLKPGDRLRVYGVMARSGTTDTGSFRLRLGTAGTIADTQIFSTGVISGTQRSWSGVYETRLESNISVQPLISAALYGYSGSTSSALPSPVTVSSAASNNLYLSVSVLSAGATDTVQMLDSQIELHSSAN